MQEPGEGQLEGRAGGRAAGGPNRENLGRKAEAGEGRPEFGGGRGLVKGAGWAGGGGGRVAEGGDGGTELSGGRLERGDRRLEVEAGRSFHDSVVFNSALN